MTGSRLWWDAKPYQLFFMSSGEELVKTWGKSNHEKSSISYHPLTLLIVWWSCIITKLGLCKGRGKYVGHPSTSVNGWCLPSRNYSDNKRVVLFQKWLNTYTVIKLAPDKLRPVLEIFITWWLSAHISKGSWIKWSFREFIYMYWKGLGHHCDKICAIALM